MSQTGDFLLSERMRYPSLCAAIDRFPNVSDYVSAYGIPEGEKVLVYAYSSRYSSFALEGNGTILTDRAIYFHPTHRDWAPGNRIELASLTKYFIFQESSLDTVHLINAKEDLTIFGRTVAPNDTTGSELVRLLRGLQERLSAGNPAKRTELSAAEGFVLDSIGRSFRAYGVLIPYYRALLRDISADASLSSFTAVYQAENYYRLCDRAGYFSYVDRLKAKGDEKLAAALSDPDGKFFEDYIADLSDPSGFTFTNSLLPAYTALRGKRTLTMPEAIILLYLCVYMGDDAYYRDLYRRVEADMPMRQKVTLKSFVARFRNERMTKIYDRLLSGIMPEGKEWSWTDSLGLDALHYALILREPSLVRKVLAAGDFSDGNGKRDIRPGDQTYDYFFAAAVIYEDDALLRDVYIGTRRQAKPLMRSIRRLETLADINSRLYESEGDEAYRARADDCLTMRKEIALELDSRVEAEKKKARDRAKTIFESRHTFACYLVSVLTNPDRIFENLAETVSSCRVYSYRDVTFVTPAEMKLDLDYVCFRNNEIADSSFPGLEGAEDAFFYRQGKTYDNPSFDEKKRDRAFEAGQKTRHIGTAGTMLHRFFTEKADNDVSELKRQYRALLKKYHPDVTGNEGDSAIIRAVIEERALILDSMTG